MSERQSPRRMPLAYVAGPYSDERGPWFVQQNILCAMRVARALWKMGFAVICPHANSALMGGGDLREQVFLDGDIEILQRCDVLVRLPRWEQSKGTLGELNVARQDGIPVLDWDDPVGLDRFLRCYAVHEEQR